ncbi:MAG: right-handed parallel beta-helix repeat-containing protein [Gemmatimonadota bacterium]|nr:right-handed parallel beta-helix repeat-containing protein [Gemmatimonadota bacterium]
MSSITHRSRRSRPLRLRDVLIPTSPILLAVMYALIAATLDYQRATQFDDGWSRQIRADRQLESRLATAVALPRLTAVRDKLDPSFDDPVAIRLMVDRTLWDEQVADLERRGWVDATLVREGGSRRVEMRRRGDTSVHWATPKISTTIRASRGEQIRGFRELALTGKTVLESYIAHTIPADFGMSVPFSALTPVYLNEQFYGLFRALEPIDESFLRRTGRMPGNIFRADLAERGEYYKNLPRNVFRNPYIWDRVAELNDPGADSLATLRRFTELVNSTSLEDHVGLMELVDRDEIARLLASTLTVGDPYHLSGVHNQYWFEDPATGKLSPIPWDLRLRSLDGPAPNPLNPLFVAALRDPSVAGRTLAMIHEAVEGGLLVRVEARVDTVLRRFGPHLEFEELRRGLVSPPGDPENAIATIRDNLASLTEWVADARLAFAANLPTETDGPLVLDIELRGRAGVDLTSVVVSGEGGDLAVWMDRDLDGRLGPGDRRLDSRIEDVDGSSRLVLDRPLALPSAWGTEGWRVVPERVHYRLFVTGSGVANVRLEVANSVTAGAVDVTELEAGTPLGGATGFHAWSFPDRAAEEIRLEGVVDLDVDLKIGQEDRLIVSPGTTVRLGPDVSIIARGRVEARGTAVEPIRFVASDATRPWGALALQGDGASGSVFDHVEFRGGGGARVDGVEYKGMVSVYSARDVRLTDVTFADNRRSDDAFNAVYAEVHLDRCRFSNANGDAVDFDYSSGTISHCVFEDSRNDAIDLMTSTPLIRSNRIRRSGDKGVSIGEASDPILIDNHIVDADRGLEIKDRSDPLIIHNTIEGTSAGILLQVKNWRYADGGRGRVIQTRLQDNLIDLEVEADSRVSVLHSQIGSRPLDSASSEVPSWIRSAYGLGSALPRPGAIGAGWVAGTITGPRYELRFDREVPFYETAVGWRAGGSMRLRHQDGALRAAVERGVAIWSLPIDWSVSGAAELTVEIMGRDLEDARVLLASDDGEVEGVLTLPATQDEVRLITIPVPAGRYRELRFEARADESAVRVDPLTGLGERRGGRLVVLRVQLFDVEDGS